MLTLQTIERKKEELRNLWKEGKRSREIILMQVRLLDFAKEKIEKRLPRQKELEWEETADKTGYEL